MLACARLGAPHTVVFGGFSSDGAARPHQRLRRAGSSSPPTAATGAARRRALKPAVDEALAELPGRAQRCSSCGAPGRTSRGPRAATCGGTTSSTGSPSEHEPEPFDAEHPLYVMYTSGTTGKPKGILHTTGGYLTQVAYTHYAVFDLKPDDGRLLVRAPTSAGSPATATSSTGRWPTARPSFMYEGTPNTPDEDRWWEMIEKYKIIDPLHRADHDPHVHEVGRGASRPSTTCPRCGCSARSASRSTPRRGCGTARTSAATAARSSTPGGRPRPARS